MALLTKEQAEKLLTKDKIIQILTARVKEDAHGAIIDRIGKTRVNKRDQQDESDPNGKGV